MTAAAAMQTTVVVITFLLLLVLGLEDEPCPPRVTQTCVKDTVSNRGRLKADDSKYFRNIFRN